MFTLKTAALRVSEVIDYNMHYSHMPCLAMAQQFLYCCMCIRCHGEVFTMSLPNNGHLFWLHHSGRQQLCHTAPSLRLFISSSLKAYCQFFFRFVGNRTFESDQCPYASAHKLMAVSSSVWEEAGS
jgi:hypothetical protein